MTDDLVERLLDWPYQGETMAEEAAVFIKQLTAERDRLSALPAVQPDAAAIREAARMLDDIVCGRGMFGVDSAQDLQWATETAGAALDLLNNPTGKEVMPDAPNANIPHAQRSDTAPAGNLTARGNAATWALYDALLTRMGALQPAHVNETPKSEHVPGVMLTPATKGERDGAL